MDSIWEDEQEIVFPTKAVKPNNDIIIKMELEWIKKMALINYNELKSIDALSYEDMTDEDKRIADAKRYYEIEFPQKTDFRVCVNNECRNNIIYDWRYTISKYKEEGFKMSHANWRLLVDEARKDGVTLFQEDWNLTIGKVADGIKGGKVFRHSYEIKKKKEADLLKRNTDIKHIVWCSLALLLLVIFVVC